MTRSRQSVCFAGKPLRKLLLCFALLAPLGLPSTAVAEQKAKPVLSDAAQLEKFNAFSKALFEKTRQSVEARLQNLDEKASNLFDHGTEMAMASMTAMIQERIAPLKSVLFGAPPEADQIYADGKKQFEQDMKALTVRVANVLADEIAGAKREIRAAEESIAREQAKLPASVKPRAAKQQADYAAKLGAMTSRAERERR
jgi:hypothetical protein